MTIRSLDPNDRARLRSFGTSSVLEKTNRILGPNVRVKMESSDISAPAYTDGKRIYINTKMEPMKSAVIRGFTPSTMMLATGLNYHELAHCLFTPRLDSSLVRRVREKGMFMSLNILEDQSAETLFVKQYEPARHYFTALVTNYMMESDRYLKLNYPLISGRLFLPQTFRDKFRDAYDHPSIIDDIDDLVTTYKRLTWPSDEMAMLRVVKDFHALLKGVEPPGVPTPHDSLVEGAPDHRRKHQLQESDEFINDGDEEGEEGNFSGDDDQEDTDKGSEGKDEGSEGKDEGSQEKDEGSQAQGEGSDDSEPDESEPEDNHDARGGSAQPHDRKKNEWADDSEMREDVKQELEDALNEAMDEVQDELEDRIDSAREEEHNYTVQDEVQPATYKGVEPQHQALVNRCVDEFNQAKVQQMPGWYRQQRSGKLDSRRYAKAMQGFDTVYKRWRQGVNDVVDFEVCFLLDTSGSMGSRMTKSSESLWILRRTFDECDGITTVLGFNSDLSLLSQRMDKSSRHQIPIYGTMGSTYIVNALKEARRVLSASQKAMRLCVIVTDGGFHDHQEAEAIITTMEYPVAIVGLDMDVSRWEGTKNILHQQTIVDPSELVDVVKNLALRLSDEHVRTRGEQV